MISARSVRVELPLKLENWLNQRCHWTTRAKAMKEQRGIAKVALRLDVPKLRGAPYEVTITRIGPKAMDSDGLAASAKGVRDGVQDALQIDDGSPLVSWIYRQESRGYAGRRGVYGCVVEIREVRG
jgi:hypothetical protein